jgi:hypothetical protein
MWATTWPGVPDNPQAAAREGKSGSFLKKRTKKLLQPWHLCQS